MPNWGELLEEIQGTVINNPLDIVRRKYLRIMFEYTQRNVIAYYSGFLQKPRENVGIDDNDKNGFMQAICGLDKSLGLDLILHTPGGDLAATESIIFYLRQIFGKDIRAFIPQIAMSGGTIMALSCKELVMGKHSSIGPIDPIFGDISCAGLIEEFKKAYKEITKDNAYAFVWRPILEKYPPTFIGECEKAQKWSEDIVKKWLCDNMFSENLNSISLARNVCKELGSHAKTFSHNRHIHIDKCEELNLKVLKLEEIEPNYRIENCDNLQDCVLTIHHAFMHTFSNSGAVKIIENHQGRAMIITGKGES